MADQTNTDDGKESNGNDEEVAGGSSAILNEKDDHNDISELLRAMTIKTTIESTCTSSSNTSSSASAAVINSTIVAATTAATTSTLEGNKHTAPNTAASDVVVAAVPTSLPKTKSKSFKVYQIPTHAFCQIYRDRIVIGVSQLKYKNSNNKGHIGSWILCNATQSPIHPQQVDYELLTLLGGGGDGSNAAASVPDEKEIYARRITERLIEKSTIVPKGANKITILLGISLLQIRSIGVSTSSSSSSSAAAAISFTPIDRFKALVEVLVGLIEETAQL